MRVGKKQRTVLTIGVVAVFVLSAVPTAMPITDSVVFQQDEDKSESTLAMVELTGERTGDTCNFDWEARVVGASPLDKYDWKTGLVKPDNKKDTEFGEDDGGPVVNLDSGTVTVDAGTTVKVVADITDNPTPNPDSAHADSSRTC